MKKTCILLIILLIFSCKETKIQQDTRPLVFGVSNPFTGQAAFLGKQLYQGSMAYINEINANGGVQGREIKLIHYEDGYEPEQTLANTKKLIEQDKVFALFDYVGTPTTKAIIRLVNQHQIPIIGLFTGAEFLRNPLQPYIFNIRASYTDEIIKMADYMIQEKKIKKIGILMQDDTFGNSILTALNLALYRHEITIAGIAKFQRGKQPQQEQLLNLIKLKPQGLFMVGTSKPIAYAIHQLQQAGLSNTFFHSVSFIGSDAFAKELKNYNIHQSENIIITQVVPSPRQTENILVEKFNHLYKKYYAQENVNYVALEGFINAVILVQALQNCQPINRKNLIRALEEMKKLKEDPEFSISISENNHSFSEQIFFSRLKNNTFEVEK